MASNNFNTADVYTRQRCLKYWRFLALFAVLYSNASLLVAASAVDNSVDSTTDAVESVGSISAGGINDVIQKSTEILPLPHVLRHQKHHSHHQPLKRTPLHQQLRGNYSNSNASIINSSGSISNKNIYFQAQFQPLMSDHFRHPKHRHSWGRHVHPILRHQQHNLQETKTATAAVATSPPVIDVATKPPVNGNSGTQQHKKAQSHFDRGGLYQSPYQWKTRGPKIRIGRRFQIKAQPNSKRTSLKLNAGSDNKTIAQEDEMNYTDSNSKDYKVSLSIAPEGSMDSHTEYDDSYGDPEDDSISANEFPQVGDMHVGKHQPAVKSYTELFNDLRMPPKKRDYPHPYTAGRQVAHIGGDADESKTYNYFSSNSDENSDADFSNEKWQRIEQEHHRKQQEHQRQMLALRAHPYSHYTEAAATAAVSAVTDAIKPHRNSDDEDIENINSQFYIPGTLTRRKQEELGTLAAVQESRRSHVKKYKQEKGQDHLGVRTRLLVHVFLPLQPFGLVRCSLCIFTSQDICVSVHIRWCRDLLF
ncbi:PREDICTED: uncharacterized protein LOC108361961 isoform X2 [Rhagoletis zephyria]|uniref:uncharacterized protein LOC108361961 isoform X2 n=1 Tax=Rhagoletis zephyria TaxID=28612 RepID=UPI0008116626|nr:PREDICTED: uncharacterized protein LOC108361961 isoform X2 [Rhagoletis zephyria]